MRISGRDDVVAGTNIVDWEDFRAAPLELVAAMFAAAGQPLPEFIANLIPEEVEWDEVA